MRNLFKKPLFLLLINVIIFLAACIRSDERLSRKYHLISEISRDKESPFYIDFKHYPPDRSALPVGVFDSGTGGLTVLEAILCYDQHNNRTHVPGADGIPDFASEYFEYLADDANMPYGRYDAEGKSDFLRELVIKDVRFMLGNRYYLLPEDTLYQTDKKPVKTIVIACNTATAFGLETVRKAMQEWGMDIRILGIIEAGSKKALRLRKGEKKGVIGILATEGTCASGGYPRTINKFLPEYPEAGDIKVIQQPGIGLAGAIDGDKNYIAPDVTGVRDTDDYRGPRIGDPRYPVDTTLLREYDFDTTGNNLLVETDAEGRWKRLQLNSVSNYIKYMVTSMVVKMLKQYPDRPLNEVILGCTHYPYYTSEIKAHFLRLRSLEKKYERIIPGDITFIDPAESLAGELYNHLQRKRLWASANNKDSRFFISVPNVLLPQNQLDSLGRFTYAYKYGREINQSLQYVKIVPFSSRWIAAPVTNRLKKNVPCAYRLIRGE